MSVLATKLGLEAVKYGVNQYNRSKMPSFAKSNLGQYYAKKKIQGLYGDHNVKNMANQYGNFMNRGKEDTLSAYKGQLINKGLGNSIAGIRGSNDLNANTDKSIADYYNTVYMKNEQSKDDASKMYATGTYQDSLEKWRANSDANTSAVSGVSSAVLGGMDKPMVDDLASLYNSSYNKENPGETDVTSIINYLTENKYSQDDIQKYLEQMGLL